MNASDPKQLLESLDEARRNGLDEIARASDREGVEAARVGVLGRKAPLASIRSGLGKLPEEQRKEVGRVATEVQRTLEDALAAKRAEIEQREQAERWVEERIDVSLPGDDVAVGFLHPLTRTMWEIIDVFVGLGYRVAEGPDVELAAYNYDALNFSAHHPSRTPQDVFYMKGTKQDVLLRTHTSPVQIRTMEAQGPPVYVVIPGRTFRRDVQDATHLSGFVQLEGLAVDEGITMGDLKGSLAAFAHAIFGENLDVRFRPHHFPFTEPSAEMDVQCFKCMGSGCRLCKQEGWIEVLGAGMVHPFLLEWVGYDSERYTGFAFGMGIERIAALAHGINDIRYFWDNDLRFLSRFKGLV